MSRSAFFSKAASRALYVLSAIVLLLFLGKNQAAYEAHLLDVRNSAGAPLPIGVALPEFSAETWDGQVLESGSLPARFVLILSDISCTVTPALLEDCQTNGGYQGIPEVYAVYSGVHTDEDRRQLTELTQRFESIHILRDHENSAKWSFKYSASPTLYIIENGKTTVKHVGYIRDSAE